MRHLRALLCAAVLLVGAFFQEPTAQGLQGPSDTPTIQVTSRLVFLDVTVLDKKGRPVGSADITVAAASIAGSQAVLASKVERLTLSAFTQDPSHLAKLVTRLEVTVRVPPKTQSIRVVTETASGGRIGAANLSRKAIEAAPAMPVPERQLFCRQPCPVKPALAQ